MEMMCGHWQGGLIRTGSAAFTASRTRSQFAVLLRRRATAGVAGGFCWEAGVPGSSTGGRLRQWRASVCPALGLRAADFLNALATLAGGFFCLAAAVGLLAPATLRGAVLALVLRDWCLVLALSALRADILDTPLP